MGVDAARLEGDQDAFTMRYQFRQLSRGQERLGRWSTGAASPTFRGRSGETSYLGEPTLRPAGSPTHHALQMHSFPNDSDPPLEEEVRKKFGIAEGKTVQAKDAGDLDFEKIQGLVKGYEVGPSAGELSGGSFLGRSGAAGIAHNGLFVGLFGFAVVSAFSGLLCRRRRQGPVQRLNQDSGSDDDSETSMEEAAQDASAPKIVWK